MHDLFKISLGRMARFSVVFSSFQFQVKYGLMALGLVLWAGRTLAQDQPLRYPDTRRVDQVDTYFNQVVEDPYRWLEDDRSEETSDWVRRQNELTFGYLKQITYRDKIRKRLESLWNYEKYSAPFQEGEYTYFYKNNGLQNQSVLYRDLRPSPVWPRFFWIQIFFQRTELHRWPEFSFRRMVPIALFKSAKGVRIGVKWWS